MELKSLKRKKTIRKQCVLASISRRRCLTKEDCALYQVTALPALLLSLLPQHQLKTTEGLLLFSQLFAETLSPGSEYYLSDVTILEITHHLINIHSI